ncbi:MAG TPA: protein translocase subunit SecF [Hyphomicrobium sp.]|uniref:protein translocase subunit SecF n=1 Tax=Hyphomicrobium sp. TaxID=82 RepID=UPI002C8D2069|nr:protein translocase subunit SecF [Hyphomicrobium sp.]HRN88322.1 protein translocase subunit SecF [Hyphomicrobium sp.]
MFLVPDFKGHDIFPHHLNLPIMRYKELCLAISTLLMVISLGLILTKGFNLGVDFKGGSLIEVRAKSGEADLSDMRSSLTALGLGSVQIQHIGTAGDVLIRVEQQEGEEEAQQEAAKKVLDTLGEGYELRRVEIVGPAVSGELRTTGLIAVFVACIAIWAYVWFRFEWQFSVGVLVGLAHDALITAGVFSLFQLQFDLGIVAAFLAMLGYSINDSIVVADRIRENMRKYKKMPLTELLNLSINETLSRTVLTGVTTVIVLLSLIIFGGEVIRNFVFCMLFGVLVGTYSSVFISSPLIEYLGIRRDAMDEEPAKAPAQTS